MKKRRRGVLENGTPNSVPKSQQSQPHIPLETCLKNSATKIKIPNELQNALHSWLKKETVNTLLFSFPNHILTSSPFCHYSRSRLFHNWSLLHKGSRATCSSASPGAARQRRRSFRPTEGPRPSQFQARQAQETQLANWTYHSTLAGGSCRCARGTEGPQAAQPRPLRGSRGAQCGMEYHIVPNKHVPPLAEDAPPRDETALAQSPVAASTLSAGCVVQERSDEIHRSIVRCSGHAHRIGILSGGRRRARPRCVVSVVRGVPGTHGEHLLGCVTEAHPTLLPLPHLGTKRQASHG